MISFNEIKDKAQSGDYMRVAEICNCSIKTVRAVVDGYRIDHHYIQYTFSKIIAYRTKLKLHVKELQKNK